MQSLLTLISIDKILALPVLVSGVGLFLIFLFLVRFLRSLFSLRLITAFTSVVYAFVIAVILSQAGQLIASMLGFQDTPPAQSSFQDRTHDRGNPLT